MLWGCEQSPKIWINEWSASWQRTAIQITSHTGIIHFHHCDYVTFSWRWGWTKQTFDHLFSRSSRWSLWSTGLEPVEKKSKWLSGTLQQEEIQGGSEQCSRVRLRGKANRELPDDNNSEQGISKKCFRRAAWQNYYCSNCSNLAARGWRTRLLEQRVDDEEQPQVRDNRQLPKTRPCREREGVRERQRYNTKRGCVFFQSASSKVYICSTFTSYCCTKYCPNSQEVKGHSKCAFQMRTISGQLEVCTSTLLALRSPRMLCILLLPPF